MTTEGSIGDDGRTPRANFNVNMGASFPAPVVDEIESLARTYGMPKARILRELALRGLAAYHRDGRLSELLELPDSRSR